MAIALRNKQMLAALIIVAMFTLIAITFIAMSTAHVNLWQFLQHVTAISYGGM